MASDDDIELGEALAGLTDVELRKKLAILRQLREKKKYNRLEWFGPYPKQLKHFLLGGTALERLLTAGNQQGKTEAGAYEMAVHLTGLYPAWWTGRRWNRAIRAWACGETSLATRDTIQKKLCGEPGVTDEFGAGMIPKHLIVDVSLARGVTDAFDTVQVRHVTGGISILRFKSYEQGRSKFQGETIDFVWDDEEPPIEIYTEQLARLGPTQGMIATTFTSMLGDTQVTDRFTKENHRDRSMTVMGIRDALHYDTEEKIEAELRKYPVHERIARIEGGIMRGEGRVFSLGDEVISEPPIANVPEHWFKLWGLDFGIGHPFAAALILWDKDADCIHLHKTVRMADALPLQQCVPIKAIGADVPVAWPPDGHNRDKNSGEALQVNYKNNGLRMLPTHASFPDGSVSTEAGVLELYERMTTNRFKAANNLSEFFEEFRGYHRKGGLIVKVKDDILSALRTAVMAKRYAKPVMLGSKRPTSGGPNSGLAIGVDFDVFG